MHAWFTVPCIDNSFPSIDKLGIVGQQQRERQQNWQNQHKWSLQIGHTHTHLHMHISNIYRQLRSNTQIHLGWAKWKIIYLGHVANMSKEKNPSKKPQWGKIVRGKNQRKIASQGLDIIKGNNVPDTRVTRESSKVRRAVRLHVCGPVEKWQSARRYAGERV